MGGLEQKMRGKPGEMGESERWEKRAKVKEG